MSDRTTKTDVIIIGAGPTGLALACQLIRWGVDFILVDKNETTTPHSKAIGVQARTLEIYEQIGLADKLIEQGWKAEKARMFVRGKLRSEVSFKEFGAGMSPYPYILIVEQGKHEAILHDYIRSNDKEVGWKTTLEDFSQDETGVTAHLRNGTGEPRTIHAKFLVGCDGAKSPVRHSLGLTFEGSTFERMYYVADVQIDSDFEHDAGHAFLLKDNMLAFFPMAGEKQWRIVGTFPEEFAKDEGDVLYEEIEEQLKKEAELDLDITEVNWFSTYKVHTRRVEKFSKGRCFLAGDSAHIHTPAGAQGMNTGIQDGYNLAWKLALVLRGAAGLNLLETYNEERLKNAENLLKSTDQAFNAVVSRNPVTSFIRRYVAPYIANFVFRLGAVRRFLFPRVSQIGINYRHASLSDYSGNGRFDVKAGDRMPYFAVDGESVYDRLREPRFHLVTFRDGRAEPSPLAIDESYDGLVDKHEFPIFPQVAEKFGSKESFNVLLRPDNYIGLITSDVSSAPVENYLDRCL